MKHSELRDFVESFPPQGDTLEAWGFTVALRILLDAGVVCAEVDKGHLTIANGWRVHPSVIIKAVNWLERYHLHVSVEQVGFTYRIRFTRGVNMDSEHAVAVRLGEVKHAWTQAISVGDYESATILEEEYHLLKDKLKDLYHESV